MDLFIAALKVPEYARIIARILDCQYSGYEISNPGY